MLSIKLAWKRWLAQVNIIFFNLSLFRKLEENLHVRVCQVKNTIQEKEHMSNNSVEGIFQIKKNYVAKQQFIAQPWCQF